MPVCSVCATNKKKMIPLSPTALFFRSSIITHSCANTEYTFFLLLLFIFYCVVRQLLLLCHCLQVRSVYIYVRVSHSRIISAAPARPRVAHLLSQVDIMTILYVSHQVVAMQWRVLNCTLCVRHHSHTDTFIEPDANSHFC